MKRKFAFALLSIVSAGGAMSCFTNAQDPAGIGPAQSKLTTAGQGKVVFSSDLIKLYQAEKGNTTQGNIAMLLDQLKSVEGGEKENLIDNIKAAVGEQFDHRQDSKLKELMALEEQLKKLKEIHRRRTEQRDQIVGDRVQQLIREVDGLGWGTEVSDKSIFGRANATWRPSPSPLSPPVEQAKPGTISIPSVIPRR